MCSLADLPCKCNVSITVLEMPETTYKKGRFIWANGFKDARPWLLGSAALGLWLDDNTLWESSVYLMVHRKTKEGVGTPTTT